MTLLDYDLFDFWRLFLATAGAIYTIAMTVRTLRGWIVSFSAPDRQTVVMRRYVIVQLLRLRLARFAGELAQIGLWAAASAAPRATARRGAAPRST